MYDRLVTINNTHWPAYRKPGATLVDLRMFDPTDRSTNPRLVFRPEKLRELGIPAALIEAAAKSDPHSCCSTTCRTRCGKQAAKPIKPQLNNPQTNLSLEKTQKYKTHKIGGAS
jgi:hypothetical protein